MRNCWCIAKMVLRAAVWKTTPQLCSPGFPTVIVWVAAVLAAGLAFEYVGAGEGAHFVPYGLNAFIAFMAVFLTVAAFFVRPAGRTTFLAALMALTVFMTLIGTAFVFARAHVPFDWQHLAPWGYPATTIFLLHLVWWIGAMLAILRSVEPERRRGRVLRTVGLWMAVMAIYVALPHEPMFRGRNFDLRTANFWEFIPAVLDGSFYEDQQPPPRRVNAAKVELAQAALLDDATSHLAPQVKGRTDIYAIGLAGWSDQDVFVKELRGGLNALSQVLPLDGHVIQLINHPDTVATTPIASRQNFAAAVRAVARVMDREEDVLLLFMTSHGSPSGVALRLSGELYTGLSPSDVAAVLDGEGIKNRILIVSACYSGIFLAPLANDDTIILTAADEKHPSFGCSDEREWTYFGDALFNKNLRPGGDLQEAFLNAKVTVAQWEVRDGLTPSNPQGHFGRALMDKLAPVYSYRNSATAMKSATAP